MDLGGAFSFSELDLTKVAPSQLRDPVSRYHQLPFLSKFERSRSVCVEFFSPTESEVILTPLLTCHTPGNLSGTHTKFSGSGIVQPVIIGRRQVPGVGGRGRWYGRSQSNASGAALLAATCSCNAGWGGSACQAACPHGQSGLLCSGHGPATTWQTGRANT